MSALVLVLAGFGVFQLLSPEGRDAAAGRKAKAKEEFPAEVLHVQAGGEDGGLHQA